MSNSITWLTLATALLAPPTLAQSEPARTTLQAQASSLTDKHSIARVNNDASAEATIRELEQHVEAAIVSGDTAFLQSVYADDFRFTHYTAGQVSTKTQWLEDVARRPFVSRRIDALDVEIHGSVAVTYGLLDMTAPGEHGQHSFLLKYIRVYEQRNGHWQMLMHRSIDETSSIAFEVSSSK
jgi:ketosteroid isomerase-like protein